LSLWDKMSQGSPFGKVGMGRAGARLGIGAVFGREGRAVAKKVAGGRYAATEQNLSPPGRERWQR